MTFEYLVDLRSLIITGLSIYNFWSFSNDDKSAATVELYIVEHFFLFFLFF